MTEFLANLWLIFLEAAPYLMVGFVVAGLLHQFLPPRFVQKHLGGHSWGNILKASLIGTPVPLCSCGVVPVGLGLQRDGASKATTVSFLIATPENGVESISLTYSFFGLPFTLARVVFAIIVANLTAITVALFGDGKKPEPAPPSGEGAACCSIVETVSASGCCDSEKPAPVPSGCASEKNPPVSSCCPSEKSATVSSGCASEKPMSEASCCAGENTIVKVDCCGSGSTERDGFRFVAHDFVPSIARWLALGFLISAVITTFMPADFLARIDPRWAVPLAALVGIPMYVCASASTPIAYSLLVGGLSPGACLVFLLTGPATNSANIPVYLKALGTRVTVLYYGGIFVFSVLMGLLLDAFMAGPALLGMAHGEHHHFQPGVGHFLGAFSLLALVGYGLWVKRNERGNGGS